MTDAVPSIYLASQSPRRRALLAQIGLAFAAVEQSVSESRSEAESPEVYVVRLALEKARAGVRTLGRADSPVLGADTIVALDGEVFGKPADDLEHRAMLQRLAGATHRVLTGVAVCDGEREASRLSVSSVTLRAFDEAERRAYWASGEPRDKAGGYAIQGRGAVYVQHLEGSYSGVMGLPLFETADLLAELGIDYRSGW